MAYLIILKLNGEKSGQVKELLCLEYNLILEVVTCTVCINILILLGLGEETNRQQHIVAWQ